MNRVNDKRAYTSPRRQLQAAQSRHAILDAARELFSTAGWQKTTITSIAASAGVSKELIYSSFGNKHAILQSVVSSALRGPGVEQNLLEQEGPRAIHTEPDAKKLLELFARDISQRLERVAPLMRVVGAAQQAEPKLANLYLELHQGRRNNLALLADDLSAKGVLAEGLSRDEALVHIWRLASPELFTLVTKVEGAGTDEYAKWLGRNLQLVLLRQ